MIVVIIIALFTWFGSLMTRESRICNTMNTLYASPDKVSKGKSLESNLANGCENPKRIPTLGDFFIKTAYNCCSAGDYKNSFVSVCALKNCIRQGARCLDFEIYSIDNFIKSGFKVNKEYDVSELKNAKAVLFGFWKNNTGKSDDYEIRIYPNQKSATEYGLP